MRGLAKFSHGLRDTLRQAPHTLSAEGEAILATVDTPLQRFFSDVRRPDRQFRTFPWPTVKLSTGKDVRLDDQAYVLNRDAANRDDRKLVFDNFWGEPMASSRTAWAPNMARM